MRHLATGSRFRHREERSDAAIQSRRLGPSSLNRFTWITAWDYGDYGDTLLNPQLSASAWARGAVGEDRGRSLAARRSRKGRRAERAAN